MSAETTIFLDITIFVYTILSRISSTYSICVCVSVFPWIFFLVPCTSQWPNLCFCISLPVCMNNMQIQYICLAVYSISVFCPWGKSQYMCISVTVQFYVYVYLYVGMCVCTYISESIRAAAVWPEGRQAAPSISPLSGPLNDIWQNLNMPLFQSIICMSGSVIHLPSVLLYSVSHLPHNILFYSARASH